MGQRARSSGPRVVRVPDLDQATTFERSTSLRGSFRHLRSSVSVRSLERFDVGAIQVQTLLCGPNTFREDSLTLIWTVLVDLTSKGVE